MGTYAVVQARMGSSRLPGKVLADICGKPMLERVIRRVEASNVDSVVIATTDETEDDPICDVANSLGVTFYRGSECDVLSRFMMVAEECHMQHDGKIVRITADSPLVEPMVINGLLEQLKPHLDYVSNVRPRRTYPRGLDAEVFWVDTLCRLDRISTSEKAREHVTWMVQEFPALWCTRNGEDIENNSDLRWTVDTETDLQVIRRLYQSGLEDYRSLVAYARSHPECRTNSNVEQKDA